MTAWNVLLSWISPLWCHIILGIWFPCWWYDLRLWAYWNGVFKTVIADEFRKQESKFKWANTWAFHRDVFILYHFMVFQCLYCTWHHVQYKVYLAKYAHKVCCTLLWLYHWFLNSLAPVRFCNNLKNVVFKLIVQIDVLSTSNETASWWRHQMVTFSA